MNKTICKYKSACKFSITVVTMIFLVACKDDKNNDDIVDKPTILTSPKYSKSEISLADEGIVIKVDAKESGIQDEDGVSNLVYKMIGSPRGCDTTGGRVVYIEKEYMANNGVFEIAVPKGCGYKYYFFAEADVVKWCRSDSISASGGNNHSNYQSVITKRSYVIEMTNQKDEVLKTDPFGVSINLPPTSACY